MSLGNSEDLSKKNIFIFKSPFFLIKIFNVIKSLINFKPLQYGIFYSNKMKKFIDENAGNYDLIFFYHIRSSQYLPKYYKGKKIIEMGDLYSSNYTQTYKNYPCRCGSKNCCGYIVREGSRWRIKKTKKK